MKGENNRLNGTPFAGITLAGSTGIISESDNNHQKHPGNTVN